MLRLFGQKGKPVTWDDAESAIWLDLCEATAAEEQQVEELIGRDVPTPTERAALEASARNFVESDALFFTPTLLGRREEGAFVAGPVNFMLYGNRLLTLRDINPRAFEIGSDRASARLTEAKTGVDVARALIEGAIERIADLISEESDKAYAIAELILIQDGSQNLKATLQSVGRIGAISALCQSSLTSLQRSINFLAAEPQAKGFGKTRLAVLRNDIEELERASAALQDRVAFLQESALGLINEKQTDVLKALSLAMIAFVPATLVASVFGMNFQFMGWYSATWGPPVAFLLMVLAPAALFIVARWLKWF